MSLLRAFSFGAVIFLLFIGNLTYAAIRTLAIAEPDALIWYFSQYSLPLLILKLLLWLVHSPMMIVILVQFGALSAVLGLATDVIAGLISHRFCQFNRNVNA